MNIKEQDFINSIREKIKKYKIPTTVKNAVMKGSNHYIETEYNDGIKELVDPYIEKYLCSISPYYFIEKYAWIDFPGVGVIPFNLYYFQEEILKEVNDFKKMVFLKSRQCGISTLFSLYCFWRGNFKESESIDIVSIKQSKARAFVAKMDATIKRMPEFLKTVIVNKNTEIIKWDNGSQILSESASPKAGRGDSLSLLVMDEAAFYLSDTLARGIVSAAQPTLTRTGGSQLIISTPNSTAGAGSYYYEQVTQLQVNGNTKDNKLIEVDWYEVPDIPDIFPQKGYNKVLEKFVKKNYYNNPIARKEMKDYFNPIADAWIDNPWLKKQYMDLGKVLFLQEIMHSFVVMGDQVFDEEILEKMKNSIEEPISEDKLGNKRVNGMWIWKQPIPKHRFIVAADPSKGSSDDFSSIEVMDIETYEQVAEYKGHVGTKMFGRLIRQVAQYYNQGFVVIEANGIGEAVFNEVYYHDTEPYDNVYKQKLNKNGITIMTGWNTNVKTRALMIDNLIDWFSLEELRDTLIIRSKRIYLEMTTWIWKNGRVDHQDGQHDDSLIALGLCIYLRNKATSFGESFFISEDGDFVESGGRSGLDKIEVEEGFTLSLSEEEQTDVIQDLYGCSKEEYSWLLQ